MIRRDEGLVLRTQPYQETSLIATLLLRENGMTDFLIKGARKASKRPRHGQFLPLSVLQVVFYHKPTRELQLLTESHLAFHPHTLHTDPVKRLYVLLFAEVHLSLLRAHPEDPALYVHIRAAVEQLEALQKGLFPWWVHYLLQLTRFFGIAPAAPSSTKGITLHISEGCFGPHTGREDPASEVLAGLLQVAGPSPTLPAIPKPLRKPTLELLLRYYAYHVPGFRWPQSWAVFEQLFR